MKPKKILWTMLASLFVLFACKKDSTPPQGQSGSGGGGGTTPPPSVTVSSISPASGKFSTVVTVTGTNFNTDTTKDSVWVNNVAAEVQQATATQLTIVVPKGAGTGAISVKVGGSSVSGPVFNYVYTITVSTLAGNGSKGDVNGTGSGAEFSNPSGIAMLYTGSDVYVADAGNDAIRTVSTGVLNGSSGGQHGQNQPPAGISSNLAGGTAGFVNGPLATAEFNGVYGVAADGLGNVYIADNGNSAIRMINTTGTVSTLAGGTSGFADGTGTAAKFYSPTSVAADSMGNVYVSDVGNQRIRKITPAGVVTTLAGTNAAGFADGTGARALFYNPAQLAVDKQGNIYVADIANSAIRKVTQAGVVTTVAGNGTHGSTDGPAASALFYYPSGVAVDKNGNIYVADTYNNTIRMISTSGMVSTLAGNAGVFQGYKDGDASVALFNKPAAIIVGTDGSLYVADSGNNCVRQIKSE